MGPASSEWSPEEALDCVFMPATVVGVHGNRALTVKASFCMQMALRVQSAPNERKCCLRTCFAVTSLGKAWKTLTNSNYNFL